MSIPEEFEQALFQEFGCHYQVTELPDSWDEWMEHLQERAQHAVDRMAIWFDPALSTELATYLRTQSRQRRGELINAIESWTRFAWHFKDKDWAVLHQLLNAIADCLDRAPVNEMDIPEHFREALFQEFVAYYNVSELPYAWKDWEDDFEQLVVASASRLRDRLQQIAAMELAAYLRSESQLRYGTLVRRVEKWTRFGWAAEDEDWGMLQRILNAIADHLDTPAS